MLRIATYMSVKPGMEEHYREEHRAIWPEVVAGISSFGIRNYSIFMLGRELYSYFEVDDLQKTIDLAAADPDNQAWQKHMAGFFEVGPGIGEGTPVIPNELVHADGYQSSVKSRNRVAALMQIKAGQEEAYVAALNNSWPDLQESIENAKITAYTIFMIERRLFSVFQVEDFDQAMRTLTADQNYRCWQAKIAHMIDDLSKVHEGKIVYLEEIFHLD